jgi:hypothetical protein
VSCVGIWLGRRGLVAVAVDGHGRAGAPLRVAGTDDAAHALLAYLEASHRGTAFELVLPDRLGREAPVARVALDSGVALWLVPDGLVDAVRAVGALVNSPPPRTAAALARMPAAPVFRAQLHRFGPGDQRQLSLW